MQQGLEVAVVDVIIYFSLSEGSVEESDEKPFACQFSANRAASRSACRIEKELFHGREESVKGRWLPTYLDRCP